jgi:DNA-binding MarR family transcriptional regulator
LPSPEAYPIASPRERKNQPPKNCLDNCCSTPYSGDMTTLQPRHNRGGRAFDSLEQEVFLSLWRTYDRLRILEEELFGRFELTPQQYNALRLLSAEHPGTIRTLDLAARLVSRAPDITRLLDKLEQRSLVERDRPAGNRRVVAVGITAAGLALLRELREPLRACHARQLGHLSVKELNDLVALLRAARLPHEDPSSRWR